VAKTTQSDAAVDTAVDTASGTPAGKGHATPTRKEKEKANKRPLVASDRGLARRNERAALQVQRDRARVGMAAGDEKFLPTRDRGPQKRYVRDYVDARFSIGELLIPLMLIVIIFTFIPDPSIQSIGIIALWGFSFVAIADCVVLGFILTRKLGEKFGKDRVEKVRWYAAMRALQLRLMRLPKPQVKRGQFPV
jgi:Protein of unknown function (DUF3043)